MGLRVDHYHHFDRHSDDPVLREILSIVRSLQTQETQMALDVTALQAAVANETTIDTSVLTFITGVSVQLTALAAQLAAEPAVQTALNDAAATINTNAQSLADAITANTPAAPPAP